MVWLKECAQENSAEVQQKSKGGDTKNLSFLLFYIYFILFYFKKIIISTW